jgi:hypothetical protein
VEIVDADDRSRLGPHGNDEERAARDAVIVAAADRGIRFGTLARQYGLSKRRIIEIVSQQRQQHHVDLVSKADPMTFIQETLGQYEAGIEELAMLAANSAQPSVKVAAIKTRMEAVRGRLELLQAVGVVPQNLGTIRVETDAREIARLIVNVLEAYDDGEGNWRGGPEDVMDAILSVVDGDDQIQLPPPLLPPASK